VIFNPFIYPPKWCYVQLKNERDILKSVIFKSVCFSLFQSVKVKAARPASKLRLQRACELGYLAHDMFKTAPNELVLNAKVCNRLLIAYLQGKIISLHFDIF